ncbi:MAG: TatD family hydrolase [Bacteroidales bacterium]|nr:TatD family hydrolase [Bacteroidales bacterium]
MEYIDTHTHITDEAFASDEEGYISRALAAGVGVMLQADIDSRERGRMFALTERHPGVLYPMLGLYPGSVDKGWQREIDELEKWTDRGIVAIGEIGLDYHYGAEFAAEQREALRVQFELAARLNLPVNIHLREATEDFFRILEDCRHLGLRGNMHAYSGSYESFLRLQKYGDWSLGIGGVVTFKKASLAEVVRKVPLERILLETDAPYLTPVPHRGERNESAYIPLIAAKVAELKETDLETVAAVTTRNAQELFGL